MRLRARAGRRGAHSSTGGDPRTWADSPCKLPDSSARGGATRDRPPKASGGYVLFRSPSPMTIPCQTPPCAAFRPFVRRTQQRAEGLGAWGRHLDFGSSVFSAAKWRHSEQPPRSECGALGGGRVRGAGRRQLTVAVLVSASCPTPGVQRHDCGGRRDGLCGAGGQ